MNYKQKHDENTALKRKENLNKKWFIKSIELIKKNKIKGNNYLDIGAGKGEFIEKIKNKNKFKKYEAIDYSEINCKILNKKNIKTYKIDLEEISEQKKRKLNQRYDLITMHEVIEHVFNTEKLIQFINSSLTTRGKIIITTPNTGSIIYKLYYLLRGTPYGENHHIRFFNKRTLEQYLFLNGFQIIKENNFSGYNLDLIERGLKTKNKIITYSLVIIIKMINQIIDLITFNKSTLSKSNLVILAQKKYDPLGKELNNFKKNYELLTTQNKQIRIKRIKKFMKHNNLKEHLNLYKQIKNEQKRIK